ncbi:low specificity L-threonine aldolase [Legionella sp. W05-934-2]|jgi:threonine aldolase|uniref:threonine aldolase family protein n=1 Tax=Legionella sp. W05-934-2 TaxID=1198649 RepID=UPI00346351E4
MSYSFMSDNNAPVHPSVLASINHANTGYAPAYGEDEFTAQARQLIQAHFGGQCEVLFSTTGTACNVISLKTLLEPYEGVICPKSAHLNVDECGAPEAVGGVKLISCETIQGKITPENILACLQDVRMVHRIQPKVVSISQCTEWGTVYTLNELQAIKDICSRNNLYLHVDGARLANAACALDVSLSEICLNGGVDILSFGGTKNGLMGAEAIVLFHPHMKQRAAFFHKQMMQLSSKMRYVSAQFIALLSHDLWKENASHANQMAKQLATLVKDDVAIVMPVETNVVFAQLPKSIIAPLQSQYPFATWVSAQGIVRWMTDFATPIDAVNEFAKAIKEALNTKVSG